MYIIVNLFSDPLQDLKPFLAENDPDEYPYSTVDYYTQYEHGDYLRRVLFHSIFRKHGTCGFLWLLTMDNKDWTKILLHDAPNLRSSVRKIVVKSRNSSKLPATLGPVASEAEEPKDSKETEESMETKMPQASTEPKELEALLSPKEEEIV
jgi:hypothetical protein